MGSNPIPHANVVFLHGVRLVVQDNEKLSLCDFISGISIKNAVA